MKPFFRTLPKAIFRASLFAIVVSVVLFGVKFFAYQITGSQAILSDAIESVVNILTAILGMVVLSYAAKPADQDHPYGHGKVEYLSAGIEGGFIGFAAFLIGFQALQAIYYQQPLYKIDQGLIWVVLAGVVNLLLGLYLRSIGKRHSSIALEASGRHLMTDFWTSAAIALGLFIVQVTEFLWIDSVLALLVCVHLLSESYQMVRQAVGGLLDQEESSLVESLRELIHQNPIEGIIQIHHLRIVRSGSYHHIDAHVVVPEFWSVEKAHDETLTYERKLVEQYQFNGEFHFHIDPCRRRYCKYCELPNCTVRKEKFVKRRELSLSELTNKDEPF